MSRPVGADQRLRDRNGRGTVFTGKTVNVDRRTHGLRCTYKDGCRCDPCRDAQAAYDRARYASLRTVDIPTASHRPPTAESTEPPAPSTCSTQAATG